MSIEDVCIGMAISAFGLVMFKMALWCFLVNEAIRQFLCAARRLFKWRDVRPFLKIAACPYSRALVIEMIEAYEKLLALRAVTDVEIYKQLQALLHDWPSPYSPQTFNPATSGVSFLRDRMGELLLSIPYTHEQ